MAQIERFDQLSNRKLKLDHLNTHHFILKNEKIKNALFDIAKKFNLPIRNEVGFTIKNEAELADIKHPDVTIFDFTIENVNIETLRSFINKFEKTKKVVELVTHCGYVDDYTKTITSYVARNKELQVLQQAKEEGLFDNIQLISFGDL